MENPALNKLMNDVRAAKFDRRRVAIIKVKAAGDYWVWREAELKKNRLWSVIASSNMHMDSTVKQGEEMGLFRIEVTENHEVIVLD